MVFWHILRGVDPIFGVKPGCSWQVGGGRVAVAHVGVCLHLSSLASETFVTDCHEL
jgi:hypothetical protein